MLNSGILMTPASLPEMIDTLTPGQQALVRDFVEFLKTKDSPETLRFLSAVDEFIGEHPDLLHSLVQDRRQATAPDDSGGRRTVFEQAQRTMQARYSQTFRALANAPDRPIES
jgi:hypothetical protein